MRRITVNGGCDCPTIRRVSSRPALLHQPRSCNRFSMAWDSLRLMPSAITHDKTNPMNTPIPQIPDLKTTPLLHITKMDVRASDAVITPTKKADLAFFRQVLNQQTAICDYFPVGEETSENDGVFAFAVLVCGVLLHKYHVMPVLDQELIRHSEPAAKRILSDPEVCGRLLRMGAIRVTVEGLPDPEDKGAADRLLLKLVTLLVAFSYAVQQRIGNTPRVCTADSLDQLAMEAGEEEVHCQSNCHSKAGFWVRYVQPTRNLVIECRRCMRFVNEIAVVDALELQADEDEERLLVNECHPKAGCCVRYLRLTRRVAIECSVCNRSVMEFAVRQ